MTDDREQFRAMLAPVVEQAPEPPTTEEVAERIANGPSVRPGGSDRQGSTSGLRWARAGLAAAAVLIAVAVGVMVGNDDSPDDTVASDPDVSVAVGDPVAGVPATPPPGYALIWASDTSTGGRTAVLRYGGDRELEPLVVTSTVVEPGSDVPETGMSGSIERWGDRNVTVDEDGRRAQFVDPDGLLVVVTGEPADVAAVVPTVIVKDVEAWRAFLDEMSADIADLPWVASHGLLHGAAMGQLGPDGGSAIRELEVSLHGDPGTVVGSSTANPSVTTPSGAVAGTCLTVDGTTICRPTAPGALASREGATVQASFGVLVDDTWWEFGWSTTELTGVTMVPDRGPDGSAGVRWAYDDEAEVGWMSWYAAMLPEATSVEVELRTAEGTSGLEQVRPAS